MKYEKMYHEVLKDYENIEMNLEALRLEYEAYKKEYLSEKDKREKAEVENITLRKLLIGSKSEIKEELEWLRGTVRLAISDNI